MEIFAVAIKNKSVITVPCSSGKYRADSASEIERALTVLDYIPPTAEVKIRDKWYPLKATFVKKEVHPQSLLDVLFIGKRPRTRIFSDLPT